MSTTNVSGNKSYSIVGDGLHTELRRVVAEAPVDRVRHSILPIRVSLVCDAVLQHLSRLPRLQWMRKQFDLPPIDVAPADTYGPAHLGLDEGLMV